MSEVSEASDAFEAVEASARSAALHVGAPPQAEAEIAPVRDALRTRCNDPLLDLRWNGRAVRLTGGMFDADGRPTNPRYEGRWEVVRYETDRLHLERPFAVICTVTAPDLSGKYPVMRDKGAYVSLGPWLVDYMQLWDRAQGRYAAEAMRHLWTEHEQAEAIEDDRPARQEALEKVYRERGSAYWMGGAQGTADPATVRSLWPARIRNL